MIRAFLACGPPGSGNGTGSSHDSRSFTDGIRGFGLAPSTDDGSTPLPSAVHTIWPPRPFEYQTSTRCGTSRCFGEAAGSCWTSLMYSRYRPAHEPSSRGSALPGVAAFGCVGGSCAATSTPFVPFVRTYCRTASVSGSAIGHKV